MKINRIVKEGCKTKKELFFSIKYQENLSLTLYTKGYISYRKGMTFGRRSIDLPARVLGDGKIEYYDNGLIIS